MSPSIDIGIARPRTALLNPSRIPKNPKFYHICQQNVKEMSSRVLKKIPSRRDLFSLSLVSLSNWPNPSPKSQKLGANSLVSGLMVSGVHLGERVEIGGSK